jgi:hypothetical protein
MKDEYVLNLEAVANMETTVTPEKSTDQPEPSHESGHVIPIEQVILQSLRSTQELLAKEPVRIGFEERLREMSVGAS